MPGPNPIDQTKGQISWSLPMADTYALIRSCPRNGVLNDLLFVFPDNQIHANSSRAYVFMNKWCHQKIIKKKWNVYENSWIFSRTMPLLNVRSKIFHFVNKRILKYLHNVSFSGIVLYHIAVQITVVQVMQSMHYFVTMRANSRFHEGLMFPKLLETIRKIRKVS